MPPPHSQSRRTRTDELASNRDIHEVILPTRCIPSTHLRQFIILPDRAPHNLIGRHNPAMPAERVLARDESHEGRCRILVENRSAREVGWAWSPCGYESMGLSPSYD